ncbi:hypothetical protein B5X24_HaOG215116 [Helicoverpa armigera]|nr:E3 ubiquitin-protein ligase RNF25 [Helicoverpa armigera]XP_049694271.1 E3 ubiquitin-protein ligase RNF25 [Helicoverpa armigera]PZC85754.1 hypothetical protein B5X24_HaOG215116 [Helicoverpa armigera]
MSSIMDERVTDEIEALEAILMDDVVIKRVGDVPHTIETVLHPSTGDDIDQQYVCATLIVKLTPGYPDTSPEVTLRNPRGLDDEILTNIYLQIREKLADCIGQPVVFELIELIRECLTESNLPSGQCMICLFGFTKGDIFIRTECYHYFHSHCLALHLLSSRQYYFEEMEKLPLWQQMNSPPFKEICPVCRVQLTIEPSSLAGAPPPISSANAPPFMLTDEIKELQAKMAALMAYQLSKGGIIGYGDSGPPPLTITTPEDNENNDNTGSHGGSQDADKGNNAIINNNRQNGNGNSSNDNSAPGSPAGRQAYRGPYRGFNRRGKPGRRGRGAAR